LTPAAIQPIWSDWQNLTLAEQVAQMVVVRASGHLFDHQIRYPDWEPSNSILRYWVEDLGIGGVILLGGSAVELAVRSHQVQAWSKYPLLVAADIEEGVGQRFAGATWFPPPMAIAQVARQALDQACYYAEHMGRVTAQEALAIGINWILAPVVDVNNNPDNPVINVRAFGESPDMVAQLTTAFIRGTQAYPVLNAAKHFPGHGDTAIDSHLDLPVIEHDLERLHRIEIPPFKRAIAIGVDAVMSAHLHIPALDVTHPATLSQPILTQMLRHDLGFKGMVVTDALVMGAIAHRYGINEAPIMAVEAGADILLMPQDPEGAIQAVCAAVDSGRIAPERIQESVARIWAAKQKINAPTVLSNHDSTSEREIIQLAQLSQSSSTELAAAILRDSMGGQGEPLGPVPQGRNLIVIDDSLNCKELGHHTPAIAHPKAMGYHHLQIVDSYTPALLGSTSDSSLPTLLQLFVRGNPFRGSAGLTHQARDWLRYLVASQQLQGLVIYGSPYLLEHLQPDLPAGLPYRLTYGQMPVAQAIALQSLMPLISKQTHHETHHE
jgi:beta-glucosidase